MIFIARLGEFGSRKIEGFELMEARKFKPHIARPQFVTVDPQQVFPCDKVEYLTKCGTTKRATVLANPNHPHQLRLECSDGAIVRLKPRRVQNLQLRKLVIC